MEACKSAVLDQWMEEGTRVDSIFFCLFFLVVVVLLTY
jgi:hypothetical protein